MAAVLTAAAAPPSPAPVDGACTTGPAILVQRDGRIIVTSDGGAPGQDVALDDLTATYMRTSGNGQDREVWVCADPDAPYSSVLGVIDTLQDHGFWRIGLGGQSVAELSLPPMEGKIWRPCLTTMVEVSPSGRMGVAQFSVFERPHRLRPTFTDLAGLPGALGALKPDRCRALVHAAGNAPWSAVAPAYAALREAGWQEFDTEDTVTLPSDPDWGSPPR